MSETTIFFLGQSAVILLTFAAGYVGIKVQIAKLEEQVSYLRTGHVDLTKQIGGVSRAVATMAGKIGVPHA
jgi:hypothetical protein